MNKNIKKIIRKAKEINPKIIDNNPKISSSISLQTRTQEYAKYKAKEATNAITKKINFLVTKLNLF